LQINKVDGIEGDKKGEEEKNVMPIAGFGVGRDRLGHCPLTHPVLGNSNIYFTYQ
jgi:hypothetical protein